MEARSEEAAAEYGRRVQKCIIDDVAAVSLARLTLGVGGGGGGDEICLVG
jgi:hypothetical protein